MIFLLNRSYFKSGIVAIISFLSLPLSSHAEGVYIKDQRALSQATRAFTWDQATQRTLRMGTQVGDSANFGGTGILINEEGLFLTCYHVIHGFLAEAFPQFLSITQLGKSVPNEVVGGSRKMVAQLNNDFFDFDLVSFFKEADTGIQEKGQSEDFVKTRDFVLAKLRNPKGKKFDFWKIKDFYFNLVNPKDVKAPVEFTVMPYPKRMILLGYPSRLNSRALAPVLVASQGWLNVYDKRLRAYMSMPLHGIKGEYSDGFQTVYHLPKSINDGFKAENGFSGGPIIDDQGYLMGMHNAGMEDQAIFISIDNILPSLFVSTKSTPADLISFKNQRAVIRTH